MTVSDEFVTPLVSLPGLAAEFAGIGRELARRSASGSDAMSAVTSLSVSIVLGAEFASISVGRRGQFSTVGATDPAAEQVDEIQYKLDSGPCVDAISEDHVFRTGDLASDHRWPQFGPAAFEKANVRSMLSFRLMLDEDAGMTAALNLYSTVGNAFDDDSQAIATLMAAHGAIAVRAAMAQEKSANLTRALLSNRSIGVAIGILMSSQKVTQDDAFALLRIASQNTNHKLFDVAEQVIHTGALEIPPKTVHRDHRPKPTSPPN